ncbi:hypothetical protein pb186bvf_006132 [Paramecium bursaria]
MFLIFKQQIICRIVEFYYKKLQNYSDNDRRDSLCNSGRQGVGKSSLMLKFCKNEFDGLTSPTLGASYLSRVVQYNDRTIKFNIWDTAGSEEYRQLPRMYYRNAQVAIIVYDITNFESFKILKYWIKELADNGPKNIFKFLVGNKSDLIEKEQVTFDMANQLAKNLGVQLKITSCKENQGIDDLFYSIAQEVDRKKLSVMMKLKEQRSGIKLEVKKPDKTWRGKYCFGIL